MALSAVIAAMYPTHSLPQRIPPPRCRPSSVTPMTSHTIDMDTKSRPTNQEASAGGSVSPRSSIVATSVPQSPGQDQPNTVTNPLSSIVTENSAKPLPTGAAPDTPGTPVPHPADSKWIDSLLQPPDSIVEDKSPQRAEHQATDMKAISSSSPSPQPSQQKPASAATRSAHSIVMITNLQVSEQPPTAAVASPRQRVNLEPLKGAPTPLESIGGRNLVSLQPLVKSPTGDVSETPVLCLNASMQRPMASLTILERVHVCVCVCPFRLFIRLRTRGHKHHLTMSRTVATSDDISRAASASISQ